MKARSSVRVRKDSETRKFTPEQVELERYRTAIECAGDGLWHRNLDTGEMWFSPRWKEILGYNPEEVSADRREWLERVHEADRARVEAEINQHRAEKTPYDCEYRMQGKDGAYRWIRARGAVATDPITGNAVFAGSHTDVTDRKHWEQFYLQVLDSSPNFIWVKDADLRFTFVNQTLADAFRRTKEEFHGLTDRDLISDKRQVARFERDDKKVLKTKRPLDISEELLTTPDGTERTLATRKVPLLPALGSTDQRFHILGVATDISELHQAQRELEQEREFLHNLMDNVPDGIFFKDRNSRFIRVNKALANLVGAASEAEMVGKTDRDYFVKSYSEIALREEQKIFATGQPSLNRSRETRTLRDPKLIQWRLVNKVPIKDKNGRVIQLVGVSKDITELTNTRDKLREESELLEKMFNTLPQCIWLKDRKGVYLKCNKAFVKRRRHKDVDKIIGTTDFDHWPREEAEHYWRVDQQVLRTGKDKLHFREVQHLDDKTTAILETSKLALRDADGKVTKLLGIYEDISQRLADEKLRFHQIASQTIGHLLKRTLGTITVDESVLKLEFPQTAKSAAFRHMVEVHHYLREVADRANALARLHAGVRSRTFSVMQAVRSAVKTCHDARIKVVRGPGNPNCTGSLSHFRDAILEMLANAQRFTPPLEKRGSILVKVTTRRGRVLIRVVDNGPGLAGAMRGGKAFEMFASSDPRRPGMGLGYVKWVCAAHHGKVSDVPSPRGAHFLIELPLKKKVE